jgi:hypothetical protein
MQKQFLSRMETLKLLRYEDDNGRDLGHPLTYRAYNAAHALLQSIEDEFKDACPQDPDGFTLEGKFDGEVEFEWVGDKFHLDVTVCMDGSLEYILTAPKVPSSQWKRNTKATPQDLLKALEAYV